MVRLANRKRNDHFFLIKFSISKKIQLHSYQSFLNDDENNQGSIKYGVKSAKNE